jgi:dTDP-4-dehydrorhamnose 3,5-epimerase
MPRQFQDGAIDGVLVAPLMRHRDERGWLVEMFRTDELPAAHVPVMGYVSETLPGVQRGPHEHTDQCDIFVFPGPGEFHIEMWDNRPTSPTYGRRMVLRAGESRPARLVVPPGVVHGYKNVSAVPALVYNFPDRLYRGPGRKEPVDEIRHELDADSPYRLEA